MVLKSKTSYYEPRCEKNLSSGFPHWFDTNRAPQPQNMTRGLKFRIYEVEKLYYLCSKYKDANQICSSFLHMRKAGFLMMWFLHKQSDCLNKSLHLHTCDTTRQIVKLPIFRPLSRCHDIEAKNLTRKKSLMRFFPDQTFYNFSQKDRLLDVYGTRRCPQLKIQKD